MKLKKILKVVFITFIFGGCVIFALTAAKTNFITGTRVTSEFMNKVFNHIHDGTDEDGHVSKINLESHVIGMLGSAHLADSAVTTDKIENLAVTSAKISNSGISCEKIDWTSSCSNTVPYTAQKFPSIVYEFIPIEGTHSDSGSNPNVYGDYFERYAQHEMSAGDHSHWFSTSWRTPTNINPGSEKVRVLFTCSKADTGNNTITLSWKAGGVGDAIGSYSWANWDSDCSANTIQATNWTSEDNPSVGQNQFLIFIGQLVIHDNSCLANPDLCAADVRIIGIEIQYTASH